MKRITQLFTVLFIINVISPSCSIQKRHYNKGFHITKNGPYKSKQDISKNQAEIKVSETEKPPQVTVLVESKTNDQFDNHSVFSHDVFIEKTGNPVKVNTVQKSKSDEFVPRETETIPTHISKKDLKRVAMVPGKKGTPGIVFGIVMIIVGLFFFLFLSILIGLIMMILGVILLTIGAVKASSRDDNKEKPLVDVVYLKNGSIIRGTIIEQVPNTSIKIQTADGSVFVYKMEEVEKMTKEPAK